MPVTVGAHYVDDQAGTSPVPSNHPGDLHPVGSGLTQEGGTDPVLTHHRDKADPHTQLRQPDGLVRALAAEHLPALPHPGRSVRPRYRVNNHHEIAGGLPHHHHISPHPQHVPAWNPPIPWQPQPVRKAEQPGRNPAAARRCLSAVMFFASAGASSAYLKVSEIFPLETRALAIAFFYAIGTAAGGIAGPLLFARLVGTGKVSDTVLAFTIGASLMMAAGLVEIILGVRAEQRSLEDIAEPLTAQEVDQRRPPGSGRNQPAPTPG
jgi:hypothetical protein